MKKIIAAILTAATLFTLAACGGKFTCMGCGEEKSGKRHTEEFMGKKITMCDDCYSQLEDLGNMFK